MTSSQAFSAESKARDNALLRRVARLVRSVLADQRVSEQVQVADRVEHLVLGEFVVVAQALGVQDPRLVEDDRILEIAAERQTGGTHRLDVLHEAESPRAADFLDVRMLREIDRPRGGFPIRTPDAESRS